MQQNLTLTYNKLIAEINDKIVTGCRLARKKIRETGGITTAVCQQRATTNISQT